MDRPKNYGISIYHKQRKDLNVLKDMLQLVRTQSAQRTISFFYVEAQTSLIPHLSLWENLQLVSDAKSWKELISSLEEDFVALSKLINNPNLIASSAEPWERFITGLLKGLLTESKLLLIDFNEDLFPPLLVHNFKKYLIKVTEYKTIYLASATPAFWFDIAHCLVSRQEFDFHTELLDEGQLKRHWAA